MATKFAFLIVLNVLFMNRVHATVDPSDFDADVEESAADADAAKGEAHEAKDRAAAEREATEVARRKAAEVREQVAAERKKTQSEIDSSEKERLALVAEGKKLQKDMKKQQGDLSSQEKKLNKLRELLARQQAATQTVRDLETKMLAKTAQQERARNALEASLVAEGQNLEFEKAKLAKAKSDQAASETRLNSTRTETARKKVESDKQLADLKAHYHDTMTKTAANENEIRKTKQSLARLEEETQTAEEEVRQSDSRMKDAQERLAIIREKNSARSEELKHREAAADQSLHSKSRENQEARLKMNEAGEKQVAASMRSPANSQPINVELRRKGRVLTHTCQVYAKPDAHSIVLGSKAAGSMITGSKDMNDWVAFPLTGKTGFVPRTCF